MTGAREVLTLRFLANSIFCPIRGESCIVSRNLNSFGARAELNAGGSTCTYYSLARAVDGGGGDISRLPFSLKVMVENLLRHEDGVTVSAEDGGHVRVAEGS